MLFEEKEKVSNQWTISSIEFVLPVCDLEKKREPLRNYLGCSCLITSGSFNSFFPITRRTYLQFALEVSE